MGLDLHLPEEVGVVGGPVFLNIRAQVENLQDPAHLDHILVPVGPVQG